MDVKKLTCFYWSMQIECKYVDGFPIMKPNSNRFLEWWKTLVRP